VVGREMGRALNCAVPVETAGSGDVAVPPLHWDTALSSPWLGRGSPG